MTGKGVICTCELWWRCGILIAALIRLGFRYSGIALCRLVSSFFAAGTSVKIVFFISISSCHLGSLLGASDENLIFHFDFSGAEGLRSLRDKTDSASAIVDDGIFVVQRGALRIASGARIRIPSDDLPRLNEEMTISVWVAKGYFAGTHPIVSRGEHPYPLQFIFSVGGASPSFVYKTDPNQKEWGGISLMGAAWEAEQRYRRDDWAISGSSFRVETGIWTHLAAVFSRGNIAIYVNGVLAVRREEDVRDALVDMASDFYIGSDRVRGQSLNYSTANMLINDLRLYKAALPGGRIGAIYNEERGRYPVDPFLEKGVVEMPKCIDYWQTRYPAYDPLFDKQLPIVAQWKSSLAVVGGGSPRLTPGDVPAMACNADAFRLSANGSVHYPMAFIPRFSFNGKREQKESLGAIADFSAAGIELIGTGPIDPGFWIGPGLYDWSVIDRAFRDIIDVNKDAQIGLVVFIRPPKWWISKFPDEFEEYIDAGGQRHVWRNSAPLSSARWRQDSIEMLRALVSHIEASSYAKSVFAYIPHGGDAGEWYWPAAFTSGMSGYSEATRNDFRRWLRGKYGDSEKAFSDAWGSKGASFDVVSVPSPEERKKAECFSFRDPESCRPVIDYREYMSDATLDNIISSCRAIKESSAGRKLVIAYYGYSMLFAGKGLTLHRSGLQRSHDVMRSPYIDGIATPIDYVNRRGGETGLNINPLSGSSRVHGKLLWHENDLRTYLNPTPTFGRADDVKESIGVIERGFGLSLTAGAGMWWFTVEGNWMFHDEPMMRCVSRVKRAADASLGADRSSVAEVALIWDERSLDYLSADNADGFLDRHLWGAYQSAARMGAPFDVYLMEDFLDGGALPEYKMYVFLNAYRMSPGVVSRVRARLGVRGAVAVWCYASGGFFNDDTAKFDMSLMSSTVGMQIDVIREKKLLSLSVVDPGHPIVNRVVPSKSISVGPIFVVGDPGAKILGTAGGAPSLAVKELDGWRSVYSLMPLTPELLMGLCDYANVHIYSRDFDVLGVNRSHISLHTSTAGEKRIFLPGKANSVIDLLAEKTVASSVTEFGETLPAGVTRIWQVR